MTNSKIVPKDTKKIFWKKGPCSSAFFYLLNREFSETKESEERAAEPLCGGILLKGHQCGMLWGSALAAGAESFRRHGNSGRAIAAAIRAAGHLTESFSNRTKSVNCRDVTGYDFSKKWDMIKLMIKSIFHMFTKDNCVSLSAKWAPEAIRAASEGLADEQIDLSCNAISCASETAGKMGATDEEIVMVAGFAGGLGLTGQACGALSAAIWMDTLARNRKKTDSKESAFPDPEAEKILNKFYEATDSKILCHEITGLKFKTIDEHTEFIKNGGCEKLINVLAGV